MNIRPIAIYPISFIQNTFGRRLALVLFAPVIVALAALWFVLPVAQEVRRPIFREGFWNAVASAFVNAWRSAMHISYLGTVYAADTFYMDTDADTDDRYNYDLRENDFDDIPY